MRSFITYLAGVLTAILSTLLIVVFHSFLWSTFQSMENFWAQAFMVLALLALIHALYLLLDFCCKLTAALAMLAITSLRVSFSSMR